MIPICFEVIGCDQHHLVYVRQVGRSPVALVMPLFKKEWREIPVCADLTRNFLYARFLQGCDRDEDQARNTNGPWSSSTMSRPRLLPEVSDYIVDLLYIHESKTLDACCLVSKP